MELLKTTPEPSPKTKKELVGEEFIQLLIKVKYSVMGGTSAQTGDNCKRFMDCIYKCAFEKKDQIICQSGYEHAQMYEDFYYEFRAIKSRLNMSDEELLNINCN